MKKHFTLLVLILITIRLFGQLNPINNLSFEHWYSYESTCPSFNCFSLYWDEPDSSFQDTLIGYNIYRNSELWRFQDYIGAECSDGMSPCPDADFFDFYPPFWIKVKAVYNSTQLESLALDSAFYSGPMQGIETSQMKIKKIFPNPTNGLVNIDIENIVEVIVINNIGKNILKKENSSSIDLSGNLKGMYFLRVISEKGIETEKIVLE